MVAKSYAKISVIMFRMPANVFVILKALITYTVIAGCELESLYGCVHVRSARISVESSIESRAILKARSVAGHISL